MSGMDLSFLKEDYRFRTLVDIGANNGEYGQFLAELFGIKTKIAFEPLARHEQELARKGFTVHRVALDEVRRAASMNVTRYNPASSLLPVAVMSLREWGEAVEAEGTEAVQCERLDDILTEPLAGDVLIKVDAQGAEREIIRGGQRTFASASVVLIEMSFVPIYDGCGLFDDVHKPLSVLGFDLTGFKHQHLSKINGRPLFAHCIYEKRRV